MATQSTATRALAAQRILHPAEWHAAVRSALARYRRVIPAARELGIGVETLRRWTREEPSLVAGLKMGGVGRPRTKHPTKAARKAAQFTG
jgi:hypothetical protein